MPAPRGPNDHVPPGERKDHPAVQRMQRQKLMQKLKRWAFLLLLLGGLLGGYVWKMKSEGKDVNAGNVLDNIVKDVTAAGKETIGLLEEEYARREKPPTDAELDQIVRKKKAPEPAPVEPTPPTPGPSPAEPAPSEGAARVEGPAPPAEPKLSPEEEKAKGMIKEANGHWDKCLDHYDKFRGSQDQGVRKKEIYAAFEEVEKAKSLYNQALELLGDNDWLAERQHRCMQVYKELKMKKGQY